MSVRVRIDPGHFTEAELEPALSALGRGAVVAYPTETLYGLAADPRRPDAVRRVFRLKGRPDASALTLIAADLPQAREVAIFDPQAERLAAQWWPGPLTLVLPARGVVAPDCLAGGRTVGVRVSAHPVARALARYFGFCVTATSANRSGEPGTGDAMHVERTLGDVDVIVDAGATPGGAPSTMVEVTGDGIRLVRDGAVPWNRVLES